MGMTKTIRKAVAAFLVLALLSISFCSCVNNTPTDSSQSFDSMISEISPSPEPEPEPIFRNAMSVSPFAESMFAIGVTYEDDSGNTATDVEELQKLFVEHGANEIYVRIATARKRYSLSSSDHSLETAVSRAKLAVKLGLPLNPELGLFSIYGDVTGQPGPDFSEYPEISVSKPWHELTIDEMVPILEKYGAIVAEELLSTGADINVWNIGNEVNFGTAGVAVQPLQGAMTGEMGSNWYRAPDAVNPEIGMKSVYSMLTTRNSELIDWMEINLWPYQAKLMNAVREGILTVDQDAKFSTHITFFENTEYATAFYNAMDENGFKVDVAGFSFYPSSTASPINRFEALKTTVKSVHDELGLPVFIAEYAYPAYPEDHTPTGPYKDWNKKQPNYEMDIEGQEQLLRDLASWGISNGICGIRPWAPDLVVLWTEFAMFSVNYLTAKARPVIDSIARGIEEAGQTKSD